MKKSVKSSLSKKSSKAKMNKKISAVHILLAIVALIECLLFITITTYSWIETASSLVIMNGRNSYTDPDTEEYYKNIHINDALYHQVNLTDAADGGNADLTGFYSFTQHFRYGKASSPDGITFYFPKRNNTYTSATSFRLGDTTDYNTSYTYFDFDIYNEIGSRDFYFNDETQAKKDIFTVSDPTGYFEGKTYTDGNQTKNKIDAIRNAMRLSVTATPQNGVSETKVFSYTGGSYTAQNGLNDSQSIIVTPEKIWDYGVGANSSLAQENRKMLFTSPKNKHMKVAVRIWFEATDADFQKAFNITRDNQNPNAFNENDFNAIAGVDINVNLFFGNTSNNFRPMYFDDYTFSNTASIRGRNATLLHASENNSNYIVWFHCYSKDSGENGGYVDFPMSLETTSGGRTRWTADNIPQTLTDYLQNASNDGEYGMTDAQLSGGTSGGTTYDGCYFAYGTYNEATRSFGTPVHQWMLYEKPGSSATEFTYNAYSLTSTANDTTYGIGVWNDTDTMRLLQFKDMATATTQNAFNADGNSATTKNFQFMNYKANSDYNHYHVFVNDADYGTSYADNFQTSVVRKTAAMYYDASNQVFKAYVPASWIVSNSNNKTVYFNYSVNGYFTQAQTNLRWFARYATPTSNNYIYTAVGYQDNHLVDPVSGYSGYYAGVGTWGAVDQVSFSTELIDYDHSSAYRYFIGVKSTIGYGQHEGTEAFYSMIPDTLNAVYNAYVPHGSGVESAGIDFVRYYTHNANMNSNAVIGARWYGNARGSSNSTFYPTVISSSKRVNDYSRGSWRLSVLIDGTYENLIYDTLTDGDGQGKLEYSIDGTTYKPITITEDSSTALSPTTDTNRIDAYRWYVPCQPDATVTYRWTPYKGADGKYGTSDDTSFSFVHDTSMGMYCTVVESPDSMTFQAGSPTQTRLRSLAATGSGFDVAVESGLGEGVMSE